ncbi:MAG: DciA family protein [Acidimicrobiales bacterium]
MRAARRGARLRPAPGLSELGGRETGEPRRVGSFLEEVAGSLGAPGAAAVAMLQGRWEEVVGMPAALHTRPVRLDDGVLQISVDHPAWAREMRLLTGDVVRAVQRLAGPAVQAVSVRVGRSSGPEC